MHLHRKQTFFLRPFHDGMGEGAVQQLGQYSYYINMHPAKIGQAKKSALSFNPCLRDG
jgi:hypothetical protein